MPPRASKRQKKNAETVQTQASETTSNFLDWEQEILISDWATDFNSCTGQSSSQNPKECIQYALDSASGSITPLIRKIKRRDVNWPGFKQHWTEEDREVVGRTALIISKNEGLRKLIQPGSALADMILSSLVEKPSSCSLATDIDISVAQSAFEGDEFPDRAGVFPSLRLQRKIFECVEEYHAGDSSQPYHSPYTSIISPSGSGKSFSVKHLAQDEGVWVIYTSLSWSNRSMPQSGPFSSYVRSLSSKTSAEKFWVRFLNIHLALVGAAKAEKLTPGMLFRVLYHSKYADFRESIFEHLMDELRSESTRTPSPKTSHANAVKMLRGLDLEDLRAWYANQKRRSPDPELTSAGKRLKQNLCVICIDEARGLLGNDYLSGDISEVQNNDAPVAFRQFRRIMANESLRNKKRKLFALLLDTSARVQNFSAPAAYDPSLKVATHLHLFPPLYTLNTTWDAVARQSGQLQSWLDTIIVYPDSGPQRESSSMQVSFRVLQMGPSNTDEWMRFYLSLGRPLWGAFLNAQEKIATSRSDDSSDEIFADEAADLAVRNARREVWSLIGSKLTPPSWQQSEQTHRSYLLAMLLFRIQFYVADNKLSESFTSSWMHYIRHISPDRYTIQTVQPGEPVLAQYVAQKMKTDAILCENMVKAFVDCLHSGAINAGDTGEMVAGLLMLFTIDAIRDWKTQERHQSLREFVARLAGLSSTKQNSGQQHSQQRCNWDPAARVHFTHICRLCTDEPLTQNHLVSAFLTGEAWFLCNNFPGADILVPVWQGPGKPMTALLIQVKNRTRLVKITPGVQTQAWTSMYAARKSIPALMIMDRDAEVKEKGKEKGKGKGKEKATADAVDNLFPVYALYLNLRPAQEEDGPLPISERLLFLDQDSHGPQRDIFLGIQLGFDEAAFPEVTPNLYCLLRGLLNDSVIGVYGHDKRGLAELVKTRSGFSFSS